MDFFKVISEKESKKIVKDNLTREVLSFHKENILSALNKIVAEDICSPSELPLYNRSTVDGYACTAQDVYCASASVPAFLNIKGTVAIGEIPTVTLKKNECCYVSTGSLIPDGANSVVMIENTEKLGSQIAVYSPLRQYENIVKKGEEIATGQIVAKRGETVTPFLIGVLSGIGIDEISVFDELSVSIISTGDELASSDEKAENGKIWDINSNLLSAFASDYGIKINSVERVKDDEKKISEALIKASEMSDIVLMSGGSSVGMKDFTLKIFEDLGGVLIHGVALKPGKPSVLGKINDKLIFGLPGNPLAASLVFKDLCLDTISEMRGREIKPEFYAECSVNFHSTPGRTTIQPVTVKEENGALYFEPVFLKSAHIAAMLKADGFVKISPDSEGVNVGDKCAVYGFYNYKMRG